MPVEFSRTTARKKLLLPGGETIYVPVVTKLSVIDAQDRGQETEHTIDNSSESSRSAHVDPVHTTEVDKDGKPTSDPPSQDTSISLYVERIDTWRSLDSVDRGQETQTTIDNTTGNDTAPPSFTNHVKTHIYRYHKDPQNPDDDGTWVDAEVIDEFSFIDAPERGQETRYTIQNPTNQQFRDGDLSGQADPEDLDITIGGSEGEGSGEGTIDIPVRLDPFQNIVNYSGGGFYILVYMWTQPNENYAPDGFPLISDGFGPNAGLVPFAPKVTALGKAKTVFDPERYFTHVVNTPFSQTYIYAQTKSQSKTLSQSGIVWNGSNLPDTLEMLQASGDPQTHYQYNTVDNPPTCAGITVDLGGGFKVDDFGVPPNSHEFTNWSGSYSLGSATLVLGQTYDVYNIAGFWLTKTVNWEETTGRYEKVAMIRVPGPSPDPVMKININGAYALVVQIYVYPTSGIKVDATAILVGKGGEIPNTTGKVYFPIAWNKDNDGNDILPTAPNGQKWPPFNYAMVTPFDKPQYFSNVVNATSWEMFLNTEYNTVQGGPGEVTFTTKKDTHFKPPVPPITNVNQKDTILQLYASSQIGLGDPSQQFYWDIDFYCDVNFGVPQTNGDWFSGFSSAGPGIFLGQPPKIAFEDEEDRHT